MGGPAARRRRLDKKCSAIKEEIQTREQNRNPKKGKNVTPRPRKKS